MEWCVKVFSQTILKKFQALKGRNLLGMGNAHSDLMNRVVLMNRVTPIPIHEWVTPPSHLRNGIAHSDLMNRVSSHPIHERVASLLLPPINPYLSLPFHKKASKVRMAVPATQMEKTE